MLKLKLGNFKNKEAFQFGKVCQLEYEDFSPYFNHGQLDETNEKTQRFIEYIQEKINLNIDLELHVQKNAQCLCNLYYICSLNPQNKINVCYHKDCYIDGISEKITLTPEMKNHYAYLWNCLVEENTQLRIYDDNLQQVISVKEDNYDSIIKELLNHEVMQRELLQSFDKLNLDTVWINKRINQMIELNEIIIIQDNSNYLNRIIKKR